MKTGTSRTPRLFLSCTLVLACCLPLVTRSSTGKEVPLLQRTVGQHQISRKDPKALFGKLPIRFEVNQSQLDSQVRFISRGSGYSIYFRPEDLTFRLAKHSSVDSRVGPIANAEQRQPAAEESILRLSFTNANPSPRLEGINQLTGTSNYLIGNDAQRWQTAVPAYSSVKYGKLYDKIDLICYGNQSQLEYDFVVAPGGDPNAISLSWQGMRGITLTKDGNIALNVAGEQIIQPKPVIYQEVDGIRKQIEGGYVVKADYRIGFWLAPYDTTAPLIIDPVLAYSTYLGGNGEDDGLGIAIDASGNTYITGTTFSTNFPIHGGSIDTSCGTDGNCNGGCNRFFCLPPFSDVFVTKIDPTGTNVVYSTYIGGSGHDQGNGVAVDIFGNAYVTGRAGSLDFPRTPGAFQSAFTGSSAFVLKLNGTGTSLLYSTLLNGSNNVSTGRKLAVDDNGNAVVVGDTASTDFPVTSGAFQTSFAGGIDVFVSKLDATGSSLIYSTLIGGSNVENGNNITLDSEGNAYLTGSTISTNFPTANPMQSAKSGSGDAFVAKLNSSGSALIYSTYLGGNAVDTARGIGVDASGNAVITGDTGSANFPVRNAFQSTFGGGPRDGFITKLDSFGHLLYSTYLGGNGDDAGVGIAVDHVGTAFVTGSTTSTNFYTTSNALQHSLAGDRNAFVTTLNSDGSSSPFSTYFGATSGGSIALNSSGNVYLTGQASPNMPTTSGVIQPVSGGGEDAYVARIDGIATLVDSDGDGLPDDWEKSGYFLNGQFVDLPGMGANPNHKDIFVEIDYMTGHRPNPAAIDMVRTSFAKVPNNLFATPNPDGADGITLHVKVDEEIPHVDQLGTNQENRYNWGDFDLIKQTHFDQSLSLSHHYCLFIHNGPFQDGQPNSGIAKGSPSSDFIVSLGSWPSHSVLGVVVGEGGTISDQAGTFMHELGHNLGLRHGGLEDTQNKPNYLSVMNYSFQLKGLRFSGSNGLFDYSRFELPTLNEVDLNEQIGVNGGAAINGYGTTWFCPSGQQATTDIANGAINWNCNKKFVFLDDIENSVLADINNDRAYAFLRGFNDWANLNFKGGNIGSGSVLTLPTETPVSELTIVSAKSFHPFPPSSIVAQFENCGVRLTWVAIGPINDYSYNVYRTSTNGSLDLLGVTNSNAFFDSNLDLAKTYTYYVTSVDALGSESSPSNTVAFKGAADLINDLATHLHGFQLAPGTENSLLSKLDGAKDALTRATRQAACDKMGAFINEASAQSGKKLTNDQAQQLIKGSDQYTNPGVLRIKRERKAQNLWTTPPMYQF